MSNIKYKKKSPIKSRGYIAHKKRIGVQKANIHVTTYSAMCTRRHTRQNKILSINKCINEMTQLKMKLEELPPDEAVKEFMQLLEDFEEK